MQIMTKRTVMGVYAPPPRLTRLARGLVGTFTIIVIVLLGLALDPVIHEILSAG